MTFKEAEQYLLAIPGYTTKNTMENTEAFISYLGRHISWEDGQPRDLTETEHVIHVAGTNGKGSVCAFLNETLMEAGYRVGMFTSPHLVCMTERFQINRTNVRESVFAEAFCKVKEQVDAGIREGIFVHPTFFEFLTGMAFVIFAQEQVDYIILETGMGGRLDATNVIKKPEACVITSISLDHTQYLGTTLEAIALEKAGIIKEGVPVIYDGTRPEVSVIIEQKAGEIHAPTCEVTMKNCKIQYFGKKSIDFLLNCEYYNNVWVSLQTSAFYQIINAAMAAIAIQFLYLDQKITAQMAADALGRTKWPGRMEWLTESFLVDGAHNEDGIRQAVRTFEKDREPLVLLYAAVRDKNYRKIIPLLCENLNIARVVVTQVDTPRSVEAEELAEIFRQFYRGDIYVEKKVSDAVRKAEEIRDGHMIFGTGSLYLAGELRRIEKRKNDDRF